MPCLHEGSYFLKPQHWAEHTGLSMPHLTLKAPGQVAVAALHGSRWSAHSLLALALCHVLGQVRLRSTPVTGQLPHTAPSDCCCCTPALQRGPDEAEADYVKGSIGSTRLSRWLRAE